MELWEDFVLNLTSDDILRGEGAKPEIVRAKRPLLVQAAEEALRLGLSVLRPRAVLHEARVMETLHEKIRLEGGLTLTGGATTRNLAGAEWVTAVVCTIGAELEALAAAQKDLVQALALEGLGNAAAEQIGQQVCERIAKRSEKRRLLTSSPVSPGEVDWPVDSGQRQVFALVDGALAGVRLMESGMMMPRKSISFVVGSGKTMKQDDLCAVCSMRERCRYRHD